MKEVQNILGWLGRVEGQSLLAEAEKHVEETCRTVAYLADAVKAFIAGDLGAKTFAIANVRESERRADRIVSVIVTQLTDGLLLPPDREDLLRFAKALDKIADTTNRTARLLGLVEERIPDNIQKNIAISTELIVNSVSRLRGAIRAMISKDVKGALEGCEDVERLEHEADDQKQLLLDAILHANLLPASLLLCYNLAEAMEAVTDRIATASDMIKLMGVKSG
jgi:predicted phosphate transport protein (TIGR00153 family)